MTHIAGGDTQCLKLWSDLLLRADLNAYRQLKKRMPPGEIARLRRPRRLARVYDDHAFWMLNYPGVDGQKLRPVLVKQRVEETLIPTSHSPHLRLFDHDAAGLYRVNTHVFLFSACYDAVLWYHDNNNG